MHMHKQYACAYPVCEHAHGHLCLFVLVCAHIVYVCMHMSVFVLCGHVCAYMSCVCV